MSNDSLDLTKKPNRIILMLDIAFGTVFFGECWPTEPMSAYFWRKNKVKWISRTDWIFGQGHCEQTYNRCMRHEYDAPVYRPKEIS